MAVFGFHLVLTMVAAAVFNKMAAYRPICDVFIFKGLNYFLLEKSLLPKFDAQLQQRKRKKVRKEPEDDEGRDRLVRLPLTSNALEGVPFFDSLILVINYTLFAILVYFLSDAFNFLFPENKAVNTSLIWVLCALFMQIHVLAKINLQKMVAPELFAERNTLLCASALFFLMSITFCAFCDKILDLDFEAGYAQFVDSLNDYVHSQGFDHLFGQSARSPIMFMASLSVFYAVVASMMFFPVLQFSSLYIDSLPQQKPIFRLLLHASFFAPLAIILLYLRPMVDHLVDSEFLTYTQLRWVRTHAVFLWVLLKICTAKALLQTFLDRPTQKIVEYRRDRVKDEDCPKMIAYFASYACTTSLQYYLPVLIVLLTTLLLRSFDKSSQFEGPSHQSGLRIVLSSAIQEPIWALTSIMLLSFQFLIAMLGVVGRRTFLAD